MQKELDGFDFVGLRHKENGEGFHGLKPRAPSCPSLGIVTFEEHPCVLRGKGSQVKYATMWLRALYHAKPNISPISAKNKV